MPQLNSFGGRLRDARKAKKLSGQWIVNYLNGYLVGLGLQKIALTTYYSWEKIGTSAELVKGKSYPHPIVYRLLLIPLGITGYWLLVGDYDGRVVRMRSDLHESLADYYAAEQASIIKEQDEVLQELIRVAQELTPLQRSTALAFLKTIR
jgi:hypothetical protein